MTGVCGVTGSPDAAAGILSRLKRSWNYARHHAKADIVIRFCGGRNGDCGVRAACGGRHGVCFGL